MIEQKRLFTSTSLYRVMELHIYVGHSHYKWENFSEKEYINCFSTNQSNLIAEQNLIAELCEIRINI